MNWDRIEGKWKEVIGNLKEKWAEFTNSPIDVIAARHEQQAGEMQEMYGVAKEKMEKQFAEWRNRKRLKVDGPKEELTRRDKMSVGRCRGKSEKVV